MNITTLDSEQRSFVASVLATARSKESADALGRAISVHADANLAFSDMEAVDTYIKNTYLKEVDEYIEYVANVLPVNVDRVRRSAKAWMRTRLVVANGLAKNVPYREDDQLLALGFSMFLSKKSLEEMATKNAVRLFNGYSDLIAK